MNIEERINSLEMELAELKKLVKEENKVWKPQHSEKYYMVYTNGEIQDTYNYDTDIDIGAIDCGNYFKTEVEAQKQADYNRVMNRFRKYVEVYSEPFNWRDNAQPKYYVCFDYLEKEIKFDNYNQVFKSAFQIYASSQQILKDAIIYSAGSEEEFKRIVFGVEE